MAKSGNKKRKTIGQPAKKAATKKPSRKAGGGNKKNAEGKIGLAFKAPANALSATEDAAAAPGKAKMNWISFEISMIEALVQVDAEDDNQNRYPTDFREDEAKAFIEKVFPKVLSVFYGAPVVLNVNGPKIAPNQ
jgi:hypothetical protein